MTLIYKEDSAMALMHVDFFSDILGMCGNMGVINPQQTKGPIGMERRGGEGARKVGGRSRGGVFLFPGGSFSPP